MNDPSYVERADSLAAVRSSCASGEVCADRCDVQVMHATAIEAARAALPEPEVQRRMLELFGVFSNATRLNVLVALRAVADSAKNELCVCDLMAVTGASQSMTSHQLGQLREAKLVEPRREGRLIYYRLANGPIRNLLDSALGYAKWEQR